jgi:rRNA maturation RNase YbeY
VKGSINFFSEDVDFSLKNESSIQSWISLCIEKEALICGDLSFIFSSDEHILSINKDYLDHDFYTDIITFDYREDEIISGDVFISIDRVTENATDLSLSFSDELHRVMIHGVLHIMGYKDKTPEEESLMRSKEDFYLSLRTF